MGNAAKAAANQVSIDHIKLTRVQEALVKAELKQRQLPTAGKIKDLVLRLATFYQENMDTIELADCDVCGAESDAALDACPYCGTGGVVATDGTPVVEDDGPGDEDDEGDQDEEGDEDLDAEPEDDEDEDDAPAVEQVAEVPAPESEEDVKAKAAKGPKAKTVKAPKAPKAPVAKEARAPASAPAPKGKGAKAAAPSVEATGSALVSTADLDAQIKVIRSCAQEGAVNMHRMGVAFSKISEEGLWKLRSDPKSGIPLFKSFKQFCTDELGLTPQSVYRSMDASKKLTEEQVRGLSTRQIRVVMQLPAGEQREQLLTEARKGAGAARLTERANQLRGGAPAAKAPEPSRAVTVAVTQGHHKLKMYKMPSTGGGRVGEEDGATRAKRLADGPWAVMELSNKVRMIIRLGSNSKTGELVADVEFRRGVPAL